MHIDLSGSFTVNLTLDVWLHCPVHKGTFLALWKSICPKKISIIIWILINSLNSLNVA